jgi:cytoskeletal protein CcmA (bactofilin family)
MYADNELPDRESRQIREHLSECPRCYELTRRLEEENRALIHALQEMDAVAVKLKETAMTGKSQVQLWLPVIAIALALRSIMDWIAGARLPSQLDWLNPAGTSGQVNLVIGSIVYFIMDGGAMLLSAVNTISFAVLNILALYLLYRLVRHLSGTHAILGLAALVIVFSTPAMALDVRRGVQQVSVGPDETIDDTLVVFGETANIDGTVNGDVVAFVRVLIVRGTVRGNILGFGQRVEIAGTVEGSVFGFGQTVDATGRVARDMWGFAQRIRIANEARIDGNATLFVADGTVDGSVGRDVTAFADQIDVRGTVANDVVAYAGRVTLLPPARVSGDLIATVRNRDMVRIADGASVAGQTDIRLPEPRPNRYLTIGFYVWQAIWLAGAFLTGLVLFRLLPALGRISLDTGSALLRAGGIGFLALIATPIAAIIIGVTLIGLPLAFFALLLWLAGLYVAKIVIGAFLGRTLLGGESSQAITLLLGLLLVYAAVNLPYVGGIINILLTGIGFGAILIALYQMQKSRGLTAGPLPAA